MIQKFAFLLTVMLIFNACSGLFIKRKYTKGYYVGLAQNSAKQSKVILKKETHSRESSETENNCDKGISEKAIKSDLSLSNLLSQPRESINSKTYCAASNGSILNTDQGVKNVEILTFPSKATTNHANGNASSKKILLIILSLFPVLCLLAVYFHDEKSVTMNFWITLALHLTLLGYAIFALLVVLNVIDLR